MKIKIKIINRDYLKRCKESSPESKLNWLSSALEFAQTKKRVVKSK